MGLLDSEGEGVEASPTQCRSLFCLGGSARLALVRVLGVMDDGASLGPLRVFESLGLSLLAVCLVLVLESFLDGPHTVAVDLSQSGLGSQEVEGLAFIGDGAVDGAVPSLS